MMSDIELVKNFTLNMNINNYTEFVDYFYKLSVDDKNDIIYYMIIYKKYSSDLKNGNMDKIYNMYKILLDKLKYNKLNYKEMNIYEHITAYLIISGYFENNELFEKYVSNYLSNITRCNYNNRLFIVLQDIINKLNKEYNMDCSLLFLEQAALAGTNWFKNELKNKILLNAKEYSESYNSKKIDNIDLVKTFANNAFIVLHEFKHILQNDYMRYYNDDLAKVYQFESYSVQFNNRFYDNNHHGFFIESEANQFALDNCYKYIKCYFKDKFIEESKIKDFIIDKWGLDYKKRKGFIIRYKFLKKMFEELNKKNIKTKKLEFFKSKLSEKN